MVFFKQINDQRVLILGQIYVDMTLNISFLCFVAAITLPRVLWTFCMILIYLITDHHVQTESFVTLPVVPQ